jgi:tetratricopeptide (TPR) repeat protein
MIKYGVGAALALAAAGAAQAQQPQGQQPSQQAAADAPGTLAQQIQQQANNAAGGKFTTPACSADKGLHFKVSSGKTYLKSAIEAGDAEKRAGILNHADQVLTEAITQDGQGQSAGAWYYKGRVALMQGDLAGADTALTKAETLAPDCKDEIAKLRQVPYAPLYNQGVNFNKAGQTDSALAYFRWAARINPTAPEAAYSTAGLYAKTQQNDSAAAYYQRAIELATAPDKATMRNNARYSLAVTYIQLHRDKDAIPVLQAYLKEMPKDLDGQKALAVAYRGAGMADSAKAIESQLVSSGSAGGNVSVGAEGGAVGSSDVMAIGVQRFQEKNYAEAAKAFATVTQQEPFNRDALYNLANSYLGMKDGPNLVKTAERLVAIDPMNEDVLKLQANGYILTKNRALQSKVGQRLLGLPASLKVTNFQPTAGGATLTVQARIPDIIVTSGSPFKPTPVEVEFEFLDKTGTVVNTQHVQIPPVSKTQEQTATVTGQGAGIVAWRYHGHDGAAQAGAAPAKTGGRRK